MNLKCLISIHEWTGCKCSKCGKTRDQDHDWSADCETCAKCGKIRFEGHDWSGCKCSICGETRDEGHTWRSGKCSICGIAECALLHKRLMTAISLERWKDAKQLLQEGADVNAKGANGATALIRTLLKVKLEMRLLALLNPTGVKSSGSPMIPELSPEYEKIKCINEAIAFAKVLIEAGAKVNSSDDLGSTALSIAEEGGLDEIVTILKAKGARKLSAKQRDIQMLRAAGREDIARYLSKS